MDLLAEKFDLQGLRMLAIHDGKKKKKSWRHCYSNAVAKLQRKKIQADFLKLKAASCLSYYTWTSCTWRVRIYQPKHDPLRGSHVLLLWYPRDIEGKWAEGKEEAVRDEKEKARGTAEV